MDAALPWELGRRGRVESFDDALLPVRNFSHKMTKTSISSRSRITISVSESLCYYYCRGAARPVREPLRPGPPHHEEQDDSAAVCRLGRFQHFQVRAGEKDEPSDFYIRAVSTPLI